MRGRARGKLGTCNQMLRMLQMPKEGCFAFSDSRPTFEYSPSRGKSPLCIAKQTISPEVSGYSRTKVQGCPHGSPYEAADSAVHRGDRGALIEGTPNCRLPASPNHPRGFSPRFYHSFREACGSSQRQPSCTSGLSCSLDRRRSAIQPLSGWLIGALVPTARLHSHGRAGGL